MIRQGPGFSKETCETASNFHPSPGGQQDISMPKSRSKSSNSPEGKAPSQRMLRVGELVRHKLSQMLARSEIHDDDLQGRVVTIPMVRMSADLRLATVYVMPLGGKDVDQVVAALQRNRKFIRGEVSRAVNLKYAPDLRFRRDESFDEAMRIDALLASDRVARDIGDD
jgi:ribosome-binding factor A